MSKLEELKERLNKLEEREFRFEMIDHWSQVIYDKMDQIYAEEKEIKNEIKKLESKNE